MKSKSSKQGSKRVTCVQVFEVCVAVLWPKKGQTQVSAFNHKDTFCKRLIWKHVRDIMLVRGATKWKNNLIFVGKVERLLHHNCCFDAQNCCDQNYCAEPAHSCSGWGSHIMLCPVGDGGQLVTVPQPQLPMPQPGLESLPTSIQVSNEKIRTSGHLPPHPAS